MKAATFEDYQERILRVLVHIQSNLDGSLSLDDLAALSNFSSFHFHRIFRGMVGESLKEHIRRLRLERAAHRLRFTGQPVTEIAFDAAYETHESFTRAFRGMFDESPSDFRKNHRAVAYEPAPSGVHFVAAGQLDNLRAPAIIEPPPSIRINYLPSLRAAFARHVGPYSEVGRAWGVLMQWAGRKGLLGRSYTMLGVVHDDPEIADPAKMRYDAALAVGEEIVTEKEIGIQQVGGGKYAVVTHQGSYQSIGDTYASLCGVWLPNSGCELLPGPSLEFYLNSPQNTRPEELLTDIYMPLAS